MNRPPDRNSPLRRQNIVELADQCVKCGLCLPHCPTYGLDGNESESPRGRIALAHALAVGAMEPDPATRAHLDRCLGCLSCQDVCPSNVRYGELLVATRAEMGPPENRPDWLLGMIKRPLLLRVLALLNRNLALWRWVPPLCRRLLPAGSSLRAAANTLPRPSAPETWPTLAAPAPARATVGLFPGCIGSVYDAQALKAAEMLLHAAGFSVRVLPAFCCGAMDAHGGLPDAAARQAARVQTAVAESGIEQLLTHTPGCLGTLRAAVPDTRCNDVLAFLGTHGDALRFRPLNETVALHLPCTQHNVAHSTDAVQELLLRIPGLTLKPLPLQPRCCGAAGSYMMEHPQRACELRDAKLDQAQSLHADRLLSANIGCRLHLDAGRRERGHRDRMEHPLTVLARQLKYGSPDEH